MQIRFLKGVCLSLAAVLVCSCNTSKNDDRPSGLKNMAPQALSDEVLDGLDTEPNDTFLQAKAISFTSDALQWTGTLEAGDIDVWHIKAKAGTIADIAVTPEDDFDIIADYSPTANENDRRFYDTAGSSHPELLSRIRLTPQGGYLTVRGRIDENQIKSGRYRISLTRLVSGMEFLESEPDDTNENALVLPDNAKVSGTLFPSGDTDVFRTQIQKPSVISFSLPANPVQVALERRGQIVWASISQNAQILSSEMIPSDDQDLYIKVQALENIQEPVLYQFEVTALDKVPDEKEPNDTAETAQTIQGAVQSLEFGLSAASDVDIFRVELAKDKVYRLRLMGPEPGQARLTLLSSAGQPRQDVLTDGQVICDVPVTDSQGLLVKVSAGTAASVYPLQYRIAVDEDALDAVEKEPNQNAASASLLPFGKTLFGHIFPSGDVDVYKIAIPGSSDAAGPVGRLKIETSGGYIAPLQLSLQDSAGYDVASAKNQQFSMPIRLVFEAAAGDYYLTVTGGGDECKKPYIIKAEFEPMADPSSETVLAVPEAKPENTVQPPQPNPPAPPEPVPPAADSQLPDPGIEAIIQAAQSGDSADNKKTDDAAKPDPAPVPALDEDAF